jgi:hypothetical protein
MDILLYLRNKFSVSGMLDRKCMHAGPRDAQKNRLSYHPLDHSTTLEQAGISPDKTSIAVCIRS